MGRSRSAVPAGKPYLVFGMGRRVRNAQHTDETKVVPDIDGRRAQDAGAREAQTLPRRFDDAKTAAAANRTSSRAPWLGGLPGAGPKEDGRNVQIDRDGCFEFELRVGDYDLRLDLAERATGRSRATAIPVRAGEPTVRTLELVRGVEVRVRIAGPSSRRCFRSQTTSSSWSSAASSTRSPAPTRTRTRGDATGSMD
jgi:hypothetical protein